MDNYADVLEAYLIPAEEGVDPKIVAGAVGIGAVMAGPRIWKAVSDRKEKKMKKVAADKINAIMSGIQSNPEDKAILDTEVKFAQNAIKELNSVVSKVKSIYPKKYIKYTSFGGNSNIITNPTDFVNVVLSNGVNAVYYDVASIDGNHHDLSDSHYGVNDLFDDITDYIDKNLEKYTKDLISKTKYLKQYSEGVTDVESDCVHNLCIELRNIRKNSPLIGVVNKYNK